MGRFDGRVAMVTGGASGIGAATVRRFVAEGAAVVIADIQDEAGERLAAELGERAAFRHCNVADEQAVAGAVAEVVDRWGRLDVPLQQRRLRRRQRTHRDDHRRRVRPDAWTCC